MNSITMTNRGLMLAIVFAVSLVALLPLTTVKADGEDIIDTYYDMGGNDMIDTYYPENDVVDSYYGENDIVDSYYGDDYCGCDTNGDGYIEEYEYQESYGGGQGGGMPSFGGSSFGGSSMGRSVSYGFPSAPMTFYTPTYHAPTQQPNIITNTSNNCVNNSCNTTTNIVNSGNTVATVYPVQEQYQVQYTQPTYQRPYCTITINYSNSTSYGPYSNQLATITWSSSNATYGYISPVVGTVSTYGSMTVYPTNGQIYTMTVYGQGGTATCQTTNYYAPAPVNPTPYVSLSQIPYTGFDFGTFGNALYWLALAAFAGAAAYLVLYFQGGVAAILGSRTARAQVEMPKISVSKAPAYVSTPAPVAKTEAPVISPIQLAPAKATSDSMQVNFSKGGEAPRIIISRE